MSEVQELRLKVAELEARLLDVLTTNSKLKRVYKLTRVEEDIFLLIKEATEDNPVSSKVIAEKVFGHSDYSQIRSLRVQISNIRKKLSGLGRIEVRRTEGFYFVGNQ